MTAPLTPRQREALTWLDTVGKATATTLRRHGYSARTMDTLAARGLIEQEWLGGVKVWRPKR
jgi:hypothetical protein